MRPMAQSASGVSLPPSMVISGLVIGALVASSLGWQAVANSASVAMKMILRIVISWCKQQKCMDKDSSRRPRGALG